MGITVERKGLGRIRVDDPQDFAYKATDLAAVAEPSERDQRLWNESGWWGDQGQTPECTAFAWLHWVADGPITHPGKEPFEDPAEFYAEEQTLDGMPLPHDGSTVRAGAKVLRAKGLITEFRWAHTLDGVVAVLLNGGPVCFGSNWYASFFEPTPDPESGYPTLLIDESVVDPSTGDPVAGGHAFVLNGIDRDSGWVRMKNSWGREWGHTGNARIPLDVVARLLDEGGEACLALEGRE